MKVDPKKVHVALLRGVNVGGHRTVAMADLRAMLEGLGFADVRSLLASGNLVFRSPMTGARLEQLLESEARKQLGLDTEFLVRTASQWGAVVEGNPFQREAERDPGHLVVLFCKQAPGKALKASGAKREEFRVRGREIYIVYPDGMGTSRFKLDVRGTARNWNTVLKLAAHTRA